MNNTEMIGLKPVHAPEQIMGMLPPGKYNSHFQPTYPNQEALRQAVAEIQCTTPPTSIMAIEALRHNLSRVALDQDKRPIVIEGSCAETVDLSVPISNFLAEVLIRRRAIERSALGLDIVHIVRGLGQAVKPRSEELEVLHDGSSVVSHMGEGVNGRDPDDRQPEPSRMVAMLLQARDQRQLFNKVMPHVPAAHEALLLPYELALLRQSSDGRRYLMSADLPWIGARTNDLNGPHVKLLSGIVNPVGIKIDGRSDEAHIAGLQERLNPDAEPGKLIFMMRVGQERDSQRVILNAIAKHAMGSIIVYDIHGVTRLINGKKVRAVSELIREVSDLQPMCLAAGLALHGVHLETMADNNRLECVDNLEQQPLHDGSVDPRLNPRQLTLFLDAFNRICGR